MTAATAPSPSPAPQHAHTPTRQSPIASDASSSRRHDGASTSASPAKVTTGHPAGNLGTLSKPIDLASPPGSPTLTAATSSASNTVASDATRPSHQPSLSPSAAATANTSAAYAAQGGATAPLHSRLSDASPALPRPPYAGPLTTPNRLLPPTPLGNASERSTSASPSMAKSIHLPAPYKAPRTTQAGASESFATAYPTQETRQKYASPAKALSSASGATLSHKRSWQSAASTDLSNKKFRPTAPSVSPSAQAATSSPTPFGSSVLASLPVAPRATPPTTTAPSLSSAPSDSRPLFTTPTSGRADNTSSSVTVTNIPKPGSSLSNQAGVEPLNLIPSVSGAQVAATVKDEYLSLLHKAELIDLVKRLEKQLIDLVEAPSGSSTLYRQARIYPDQINVQIERLKARQRIAASTTATATDLSLKDVYSLLNATSRPAGSVISRAPTTTSALTGRPAYTPPTGPRRTLPLTPTATRALGTAGQKVATGKDTTQNASLSHLISSITAMARQQNQPARGPNGAPLPPPQTASTSSTPQSAVGPGSKPPQITPAALRSIVGDGPMPSNAALAAAIAAHFGGSLPANAHAAPRPAAAAASVSSSPAPTPSSVAAQSVAARAGLTAPTASAAAARTSSAPAPASSPSKDISDKIAAILGSSASSQTPMLGPQGLPLAPAAAGSGSGPGSSAVPLGNIAAMLSTYAGQAGPSSASAGSPDANARTGTPATQNQGGALSSLLQQLEEAKKQLPSPAVASSNAGSVSSAPRPTPTSALPFRVNDPVAILTGASANPIFTPTYGAGSYAPASPITGSYRTASWSPDPQPVIVQGPLGTSTLPSYEDMIVEGLRVMGSSPPRTLFNWMQDTYPLMKKFRPSAHQALQKAFKRGRLLKTGSLYRINPSWSEPGDSRKPTRRPQVGQDHPMVRPGLNGEVLAVSPHKDSQAYRNVGDSGLRMSKGLRTGPRPYGQPGAAPLANPASTIFPSGSATEILLEYQKRIGKKIEPDSVRYLYQLIRSGPSDGSMEEMLAHMLTQTGYHDAAAEATAAAAAQTAAATAAGMPTSMSPYARPNTGVPYMATGFSSPSSMFARTGAPASVGSAADRRGLPPASAARGPTSLPLHSTSEPSMMQQLATMLSDTSNRFNPALASSILGQLSSNAAAQAAARAADMSGMTTGPPLPPAPSRTVAPHPSAPTPSASSQLASALSSLAGQTPQHDLDSAVSETLAAALQQIGAGPTAEAIAAEESAKEAAPTDEVAGAAKATQASEPAATEAVAIAASGEGEEGIDLAEYEDAIRALTSAFGNADDDADSDESDVEADERAIAAAEAEPDSVVEEPPSEAAAAEASQTDGKPDGAGEAEEGEAEEDEEDGAEEEEQMDLTDVLRQLTASLQAHQEAVPESQDHVQSKDQDDGAAAEGQQAPAEDSHADSRQAEEDMDVDPAAEEQRDTNVESAEDDAGAQDAGSIQAQLEALVASLAANAGNADEDGEDEDEDGDDDDDDGAEENAGVD
ncbi:hypothetical protein PHSY_003541 [Pseudozyma hubeiensis SY62]|uniref:Histone H1 n=1 Tax=Pseudozyma hubeiensis (strain SY62) TaxID=1305764 RepID=R9P3E4_PSEHS|nr:hypothetical protein PHSY_003541 [Pseudozyma hubeiensis SY62]GAC95963.1 hypothetical protein PHSY_003541 [Pseudozyma hubeiensis SY62]